MTSIRRRLLTNLLLVGTLLCVFMAGAVALLVRSQVGELLDYQLEQVARTLIDRDLSDLDAHRGEDPAMHLEIQIGDENARLLYSSNEDLGLPLTTPLGLTTLDDRSGQYDAGLRVFTLRSRSRVVQVIQPMSLRHELTWEAAAGAMVPSVVLLAALSGLIVVTIRRELAPLRRLTDELEARGADALTPIDLPDAPSELRTPVLTLNRLLRRLEEAIRAHREFVADAAHELRSPLAAIRLQAGNVAAATSDAERQAAVMDLARGVDRAGHLVQQLLTLARLEPSARPLQRQRIDLRAIAQECLVDHVGEAAAKGMQLGLSAESAAWLAGDGEALRAMLDNLLVNAIKYAPERTPIDVSIANRESHIRLTVRDHGPGIPPEERARVFQRFHRLASSDTPGSGLGLAIVHTVVRAHGGTVRLLDPLQGKGLLVEIQIPFDGDPVAGAMDHDHGPFLRNE